MSAFDTPWFNSQDRSFFNTLNKSKVAHVILSAETSDFAEEVFQQWQAAGFHVVYVPLLEGGNDYVARVKATGDSMGASEQYAVVGTVHPQHPNADTLPTSDHRPVPTPKEEANKETSQPTATPPP